MSNIGHTSGSAKEMEIGCYVCTTSKLSREKPSRLWMCLVFGQDLKQAERLKLALSDSSRPTPRLTLSLESHLRAWSAAL